MSDSDTPYTSIKRKGQGSRTQKKKTRSSGPPEDEDDIPTPRSLRKRTHRGHENGDSNEFGDKSRNKRRKFFHVVFKSQIKSLCEFLLEGLVDHKFAYPFVQPVDTVKYPSYLDKIKEPMDFSTIKKKMGKDTYTEAEDFAMDVRLIFKNCLTFNDHESDLAFMAQSLRKLFEDAYTEVKRREQRLIEDIEFEDMKQQFDSLTKEHRRMRNELNRLVTSPTIPHPSETATTTNMEAVKKEKKPKRPWDLKRKEVLSRNISLFTEAQLEAFGTFVSQLFPTQNAQGELELDLENQPDDKLSKLERFVIKTLKASGHIEIDEVYSESENESEKKIESSQTKQTSVPETKSIEQSKPIETEPPKPVVEEPSTIDEKDKKDEKPPELELEPLPISSKTTIVQTTTVEKSEDSSSLPSSENTDMMQIDNAQVNPEVQKAVESTEPRTVEMTDASITTRS